jgi:hypothetical protein
MDVTSDNRMKNINKIRGQNSQIFNVKACGTYSNITTVPQRVNMLTSTNIIFSKMIPFNKVSNKRTLNAFFLFHV